MVILSDNTKSLLTALFVTTAQNRFSAAEAAMMPVDGKQGLAAEQHEGTEHT
jgi:hypothetical protein